MAPTNPHEEQWARWVVDTATEWGHVGRSFHDRKRHVVSFVGLGDVELSDPERRVVNFVPEEQRNEMRRRCHRLLARHFQVPSDWVTDDDDLNRKIRGALIRVREYQTSPRAHAEIARFGQRLGIAGWEERWRWAADAFIAFGTEKEYPSDVVSGALMWCEIGEPNRAAAPADLIIRGWDPLGDDQDVAVVPDVRLHGFVLAVWWRDGRAALASLIERRPNFDGNTRVESFALAALAAETGATEELEAQIDRLTRMLRASERESGALSFLADHDLRHMLDVTRSWLVELDPAAQPEPTSSGDAGADDAGVGAAMPARVTVPVRAAGVAGLSWRGDVLVAVTPDGDLAVDLEGQRALAPPSTGATEPPTERVRTDGTDVFLERTGGSSVLLRRNWDEDQLEEADTYEVTVSPAGERLAVWGEYGPIFVFGADGSPAGEFNDHWNGPTYGVEFGVGRMMSWARDGRAVVYDLERRLVVGAVQLDGWPENAAFHRDGRIVLTYDNVAHWLAHDIDAGKKLGPVRPARHAVLHPTRALTGWADAEQLWIEEYVPDR